MSLQYIYVTSPFYRKTLHPLYQLQVTPTLPVGDSLFMLFDLPATGGDEVLDEFFAKIFVGESALFKQIVGSGKIASQGFDLAAGDGLGDSRGIVGIALETRGQFKLMLDAVEAAGEQGSKDEIEIGIGSGNAILDADGTL